MRQIPAVVLSTALLAGCAKAYATEPNSGNPVHCAAAFAFAHNQAEDRGDQLEAKYTFVRVGYELEKAKVAGNSMREITAASRAFNKANRFEPSLMSRLGVECRDKQNADPQWHDYQDRLLAKWKAEARKS